MSSMMDSMMGGGPPQNIDLSSLGGGAPSPPSSSPTDAMAAVIAAIQQYLQVEPDDIDKQVAMELLAKAQSLLAKDQKEKEAAGGITPLHKGLASLTAQGA